VALHKPITYYKRHLPVGVVFRGEQSSGLKSVRFADMALTDYKNSGWRPLAGVEEPVLISHAGVLLEKS
jgi:hypothetical protein